MPMKAARLLAGAALVAALALLSSDALYSQDQNKKTLESGKRVAKGKLPPGWDRLDLTADQRQEVTRLTAEYRPKIDRLQEELGRLKAELARKRVALLTDGQKKTLVEVATAEPAKDRPKEKDKATPAEKSKE
jgi:uncharacterized protein HemX